MSVYDFNNKKTVSFHEICEYGFGSEERYFRRTPPSIDTYIVFSSKLKNV